jgi:hypothetical protein
MDIDEITQKVFGKIINLNDLEKRNDNNHYHIAPFRFEYLDEGKITMLILDEKFYNTRIKDSEAEDNIRNVFSDIIIEIRPNIVFGSDKYPEFIWDAFYKIYNIIMDWYSPVNWHMYLGYQFERLEINKKYYEILEEISKLQMYGRNYQNLLNDPFLDPLKEQIKIIIENIIGSDTFTGVFVKTDRHSTKHDYPIRECFTPNDVIEHIFGGITAIRELKNHDDLALYFKKWKSDIGGENEFRAFVDDGKIIGISQQFLYNVYTSMKYHIENRQEIYQAIQNEWNRIYNLLDNKHKYKEAIIDFFIEYDDNDTVKVFIIEINTIGKWGPAGSSLFKWIDDPPSGEHLEFRITE